MTVLAHGKAHYVSIPVGKDTKELERKMKDLRTFYLVILNHRQVQKRNEASSS